MTSGLSCTSPQNGSGLQATSNVRLRAESTPNKPPQRGRCTQDAIDLMLALTVALISPRNATLLHHTPYSARGYIEVFASIHVNRLFHRCFQVRNGDHG